MLLSDAKEQTEVTVTGIDAGRALTARLAAMGLIPGSRITIQKNSMKVARQKI